MTDDENTLTINGYGSVITTATTKTYLDLDLDFSPHPVSKDIIPLKNSAAVGRSLRNLLFTAKNERLFNPMFGTDIRNLLFEPMSPATTGTLKTIIVDTVREYEPRAKLMDVVVVANEDENRYDITLTYAIDALSEITNYNFFLERLR